MASLIVRLLLSLLSLLALNEALAAGTLNQQIDQLSCSRELAADMTALGAYENALLLAAATAESLENFPTDDPLSEIHREKFVYGVPLHANDEARQGVLRLAGEYSNPRFEAFASRFVRAAGTVISPLVRYIPAKKSKKDASLALFYPGARLEESWQDMTGLDLRKTLLQEMDVVHRSEPFYFANRVLMARPQFSEATQRQVFLEFRDAFRHHFASTGLDLVNEAGFYHSVFLEKFGWRLLLEHPRGLQYSEAMKKMTRDLLEGAWRQLPASLRVQLADRWALAMVLGIEDLHNKNALGYMPRDAKSNSDSQMIWLDLAYKTEIFISGKEELKAQLDAEDMFGEARSIEVHWPKLMARELSEPMRNFLNLLNRDFIRSIARPLNDETQWMPISERQILGMLGRSRLVLEMAADSAAR